MAKFTLTQKGWTESSIIALTYQEFLKMRESNLKYNPMPRDKAITNTIKLNRMYYQIHNSFFPKPKKNRAKP